MKIIQTDSPTIEPQTKKYDFASMEQLVINGKISFYEMMSETYKLDKIEIVQRTQTEHEKIFYKIIDLINSGNQMREIFKILNTRYDVFYNKCTTYQRELIYNAKINNGLRV